MNVPELTVAPNDELPELEKVVVAPELFVIGVAPAITPVPDTVSVLLFVSSVPPSNEPPETAIVPAPLLVTVPFETTLPAETVIEPAFEMLPSAEEPVLEKFIVPLALFVTGGLPEMIPPPETLTVELLVRPVAPGSMLPVPLTVSVPALTVTKLVTVNFPAEIVRLGWLPAPLSSVTLAAGSFTLTTG